MIKEEDVFVDGEKRLGRYTVVILKDTRHGWRPAMMHLDCMVTNYRIMLRPFRKKYAPASLPARYVSVIELTKRGRYNCVRLQLITGHELYLMLGTGHLEDLEEDLQTMKIRRPRFQFDDRVARRDIERLITFFGREILPDAAPDSTA